MNRRQHLQQDEDDADEGERAGEAVAALHRADEHAHRDGEDRRQHAAQHEHDPPGDREAAVGLRQDGEELSTPCARADRRPPTLSSHIR